MGVMGRLRIFVVKEPVVAASCLIAGFGCACGYRLVLLVSSVRSPGSFICLVVVRLIGDLGRGSMLLLLILAAYFFFWKFRSQLQLGLSIMVVEFPRLPVQSMTAGLFLPAVVRPILDSFETAKQVPQPALSDVVGGVTSKN